VEKHKNLRKYYSYLSDYYKKIDFKFDALRYYDNSKADYSEEDRETYDFFLYLFEQMREIHSGTIKCESSGYATEALNHQNKTTSFKQAPRYVADNSKKS
jgi:hypothetical protein